MTRTKSPRGLIVFGVFLSFGSVIASLAGTSLVLGGTALDRMWSLNPDAYKQLAPFGRMMGFPFLVLGVGLAISAVGWFNRRLWGWWSAVVIIGTQLLGDLINVWRGQLVPGAIGFAIAGAVLFYLFRRDVRAVFDPEKTQRAS